MVLKRNFSRERLGRRPDRRRPISTVCLTCEVNGSSVFTKLSASTLKLPLLPQICQKAALALVAEGVVEGRGRGEGNSGHY